MEDKRTLFGHAPRIFVSISILKEQSSFLYVET